MMLVYTKGRRIKSASHDTFGVRRVFFVHKNVKYIRGTRIYRIMRIVRTLRNGCGDKT